MISLTPEAFEAVFPFHIAFDRNLTVLQAGAVVRRICPGIAPGVRAADCLRLERPAIELTWEEIQRLPRAVFVLRLLATPLSLRGQMVTSEADGSVVFIGSPSVTDLASVAAVGLTLDDFAIHDSSADFLFLLQSRSTMLEEARRVSANLTKAREQLARELSHAAEQEQAIRSLSTPILRVWKGVLAVPVIGALDDARAAQLEDRLLAEITRTGARVAVLDLSGVDRIDQATARHLLQIGRVVSLLGSRCVIAALSPEVAKSLVALDVDLSDIPAFPDLQSALGRILPWLAAGRQ